MPLVHQARLIIGGLNVIGGLNGKSAPAHASRTYALSIGLGGQANRTAQRAAGATNGGGLAAGLMKAVIRSEITPDRAARMAYQTIDPIQPEKLKLIVPIAAGSTSVTHTPAATSIMLRHRFSGVMHPTSVRPTSVLTALATPTAIRLSAIQKTIPETLMTTPIKMIARIMNFQFTASAPKFGALTSC